MLANLCITWSNFWFLHPIVTQGWCKVLKSWGAELSLFDDVDLLQKTTQIFSFGPECNVSLDCTTAPNKKVEVEHC